MRKINELIWHCTATPEGREVSVAEVDAWHKARGWSGIGYHKLVHLDGSVSEGRPISRVGAHVANRNIGTIGYAYVGGVDANNVKKAEDTRTSAQKATMRRLTIEAIERYGVTMVSGHSDYANKACPCFPARAEYAPLLKRKSTSDGMPEIDPASDMSELKGSRTVQGAAVGLFSGGAITADNAMELLEASQRAESAFSVGNVMGFVAGALVVGGCVYTIYVRWDDAGRPVPWARKNRRTADVG